MGAETQRPEISVGGDTLIGSSDSRPICGTENEIIPIQTLRYEMNSIKEYWGTIGRKLRD